MFDWVLNIPLNVSGTVILRNPFEKLLPECCSFSNFRFRYFLSYPVIQGLQQTRRSMNNERNIYQPN